MPRTFLDTPYAPADLDDPDHSSDVAAALKAAYDFLARRQYAEAGDALEPVRGDPMSDRQRLRVAYILAQAAHDRDDYNDAAGILEDAIDLAESIEAFDEYAQLAHLLAVQYDYMSQWALGAQASTAALAAWQSRSHLHLSTPVPDPLDLAFEVDLRDRLAIELFNLARLDEAVAHLQIAFALTPSIPDSALRAAGLQWTLALVERWRGHPLRAREHIRAAFDAYYAAGDRAELPRLQIVAADIGLDLAAGISSGGAFESRDAALDFVARHLLPSVAETSALGDDRSHCRSLLTYARYQRLAAHNTDRIAVIESVGRTARRLSDDQLVGMYFTELGDELAHLGSREEAKAVYQLAMATFERTQAPALGVWAQRAFYDVQGH